MPFALKVYIVMACIGIAHVVIAYTAMVYMVMADIVMAYIIMADVTAVYAFGAAVLTSSTPLFAELRDLTPWNLTGI